ncbi:FxSxx-COOH system tetratricopeptide repeat protein [Parafrankia sp. EUN1f]|uniref:FxSxx-COOH system tetratricopeptide repeat protein n=1 Tax=Parafrankia sp. EUN1f TaxID=102897 RepID=UPI0001C44AE8|nr:FxSxx-COOH system tetratricopeptide repeat protein [Parafrankia sp. EUN1f]EFC83328.1 NB-ARC domain protein [Parafrankia sp. EUN1f]
MGIVVDDSPTFAGLWGDAVAGLVQVLRRQPAFGGNVITHRIAPDGWWSGRLRRPPSRLEGRGRCGVVWLLTDGLGEAWRSGRAAWVLAGWARSMPVVVVDVLAPSVWEQTDLGVERIRLQGAGWRQAGRVLSWEHLGIPLQHDASDDGLTGEADRQPDLSSGPGPIAGTPPTAVTPLPVIALDPEWVYHWARYVSADGPTWREMPALLASSDRGFARRRPRRVGAAGLALFAARASPRAQRVAGLLAAVSGYEPPLDGLGLRTIAGIAGADRRDLSELFAFGLLSASTGPGPTVFQVPEDVHWTLCERVSRGEVVRAVRAVEATTGRPFRAGLSPDGTLTDDPGSFLPAANSRSSVDDASADSASGSREPAYASIPGADPTPRPHNTESDFSDTMSSIAGSGRPTSSADESSMDASGVETSSQRGGAAVALGTAGLLPVPAAGRLPRIWGTVPPQNPHFTGREDLLAELHARLVEGATTVLPEALHGTGGVGKTQLVTEYIYRHLGDFDVIWWIPAEQSVQIGIALAELGEQLKIDLDVERSIAVRQVVEALRIGEPYGRWLLVFDNADDPAIRTDYFPASPTGRVLVTSRNPGWGNVSHPLEVTVFRREESIKLLRSRGGPLDDDSADQVADVLGDLPLAVEQAAAWRADTGMSAQEYLRLLEEHRGDLLGTPPADYPVPVTAAWNISLDRLAVNNPAALELLQVCAFFAPEPIPRQILSRAHNEKISPALDEVLRDPVKLSRAIRDINRFSLTKINYRDNSIDMHRLIQQSLLDRMTPEQRQTMRHGAHVLLAASDPNAPRDPDFWKTYADLYPHIRASRAEKSADPRVRKLLLNECDYLWAWGDQEVSNGFARAVRAEWHAAFGEEDSYSLQMEMRFGWGLILTGRYDEAAEVNQRALDLCTRVNGPDDELTIELMDNVGIDLRWRGEFEAALELARDAHQRALRTFDPDDAEALSAAHGVAITLRLLGRFAESAKLDEDVWQRSVRLYGEDARTLNYLTALTIDRRELGDYVGARAAQETIHARYQHMFQASAEHPARLQAGHTLAVAYRKAGDHDRALALSKDVRERILKRYGAGHPASIATALTHSIDLRHAGQLHEARELCAEALRGHTAMMGATHPHALAAALNLAVIERLSGDASVALDRDERTLAAFVERLGERHPSTLAIAANLASDLYALGRFTEAHDRDRATLDTATAVLGETHPSTLAIAANLALDLRARDRGEEALALQGVTVGRLDAVLGRDHPATRQVVAGLRMDLDVDPMPV